MSRFRRSVCIGFLAAISLVSYVVTAQSKQGRTYYIANTGNDSNNGLSESNAKQTLRAAEILINRAAPGDSILFRRGDTWSGNLVLKGVVGTASERIVVGAFGSGEKPIISTPTNTIAIFIRSADNGPSQYLTLRDIEVTTSVEPSAGPKQGIFIGEFYHPTEPHDITIDNMDINGFGFGIQSKGSRITIENSHIHNNHNTGSNGHSSGFIISGTDITIRNNVIHNNGKQGSGFDHNAYLAQIVNLVFQSNEIYGGSGNVKVRGGENIVIRDNYFHDLTTSAIGIGASGDRDLDGAVIESNLIERTGDGIAFFTQGGGGIDLMKKVVVRNNIFRDRDIRAGGFPVYFPIGGSVDDLVFEHNTFSNINGEPLVNISAQVSAPVVFRNNIFSDINAVFQREAGAIMDRNLYHDVPIPGIENNAVSGNPDFISKTDLRPASSSDAIDSGIGNLSTDFSGNARDINPDLGAHEYEGDRPAQ